MALIITIDGPGRSGKDSAASKLCQELSFEHVDLGLGFRGLASRVLNDQPNLEKALLEFCLSDMRRSGLRTPQVDAKTHELSADPSVRKILEARLIGLVLSKERVIVTGRSGHYLFPAPGKAVLNIFLTASLERRVERECHKSGKSKDEARASLFGRDREDMERSVHPLLSNEQARKVALKNHHFYYLDNSGLCEDDTFFDLIGRCRLVLELWQNIPELIRPR